MPVHALPHEPDKGANLPLRALVFASWARVRSHEEASVGPLRDAIVGSGSAPPLAQIPVVRIEMRPPLCLVCLDERLCRPAELDAADLHRPVLEQEYGILLVRFAV